MSEAPNMEPSREPATAEAPATLTPALDQSEWIRRLTPVKSGRGHWRSYTVASGLALIIIAARVALNPVLGHEHDRHLFLLPAVMLAAWVGGLGPGCVATILCTGALSWLWNARGATAFPVVTLDVVLFFLVGIAVCALIESLRVARSHAESARAARDQLLAIVVHDLGNPLSAIKLAAATLRRNNPAANSGAIVADRIDRSVTRMSRLVHDLRDATQIERGSFTVNATEERVSPILLEVADEFSTSSQARNIRLEATSPSTDTTVRADRDRLAQVLGNLVGNALKFTPPGGRIDLRAEERGDVVLFEVKDTGPGIESEHVDHVFERYWKTRDGGAGLGLFIAEAIVRAHGGSIDVLSVPGFGARFFFTLPRG
jgi:signal transduction histidine kinase